MASEPIYVPPPFQFGPLEKAFALEETYCFQNGIFKWLRQNVGKKNQEWFTEVPGYKNSFLGYLICIRIKDPATEMQFRLMHSDHEIKLCINQFNMLSPAKQTWNMK
jgi:hypothetical protein